MITVVSSPASSSIRPSIMSWNVYTASITPL
jgi:hypothetical protein